MQSAEDDLVGRMFGSRYRIARMLGRGGMGSVYEALDVDLDRRVALKVMLPELSRDPVLLERFRREVVTAARIHHPNVVQVTDFGRTKGDPPFFVMELLSGRPLVSRLKRGPLEPRRAVRITMQVLSALDTAHAMGIVHRDLKPENVFLITLDGGSELVKLLDFGLAKLLDGEAFSRLTKAGVLVGTPRYAAPEQVKGSQSVDARCDVYAAGVLLYAMLTGRPPFRASLPQLWTDVLKNEPTDPRIVVPDLPPELVDVVRKAMRKSPDERYPSARAMAEALAPFASSSRSRSMMPPEGSRSLVPAYVSRVTEPPRRSPLLAIALLLLALGAAAVLAGGGAIAWRLASRVEGDGLIELLKAIAGGNKPSSPMPAAPMAPLAPAPVPAPPAMAPDPSAPAPMPGTACEDYERRACDCPAHPEFCQRARNEVQQFRAIYAREPDALQTMCANALEGAEQQCGPVPSPWQSPRAQRPSNRPADRNEGGLIPPW